MVRQVGGRLIAALALLAASPLLGLSAVAIRFSSPGPVLFRAERVGRDGAKYRMYKLRTMHVSSAPSAAITASQDPRVFRAGHLLRRLKIDELPQLYNVVRGEMALVGPRPEDPNIVQDHYTEEMRRALSVLPGLTSPATLDYFANEQALPATPDEAERQYVEEILPRKLAMELVYVENRTARYDLEIVLRTVLAIVGVRRAFRERQAWEHAEAERILARIARPGLTGDAT